LTIKGDVPLLEGVSPAQSKVTGWYAPNSKGQMVQVTKKKEKEMQEKGEDPYKDATYVTDMPVPSPLPPTKAEGKGAQDRSKYGGFIIPPEPGGSQLKILTWNTGEFDPRLDSNASHAEPQFVQWILKPENKHALLSRVTAIKVELFDWNPCARCAVDLNRVLASAPKGTEGTVIWTEPYPGPSGVVALETGRWKTQGPGASDAKADDTMLTVVP
jgi:hypothetical protein